MRVLWRVKWFRWLTLGLFLAVCGFWLFANLDLRTTIVYVKRADHVKILLYLPLLMLAVWVLRALRWGVVLRSAGVSIDPLRIYLSTATSLGLAAVTPAQSGEMLKIKHAADASKLGLYGGIGGFAAERFYDASVLLMLTILAALVTMKSAAQNFTLVALAVTGVALAGALVLNTIPAGRLPAWLVEVLNGFKASTSRPAVAIGLAALTAACWLLTAVSWQVAMSAVGVDVTLAAAMAIVGIVMFAILASMVPAGIGVSELTISGLLVLLGFAPEQALSAALILRVLGLWAVVLGLIHWCLFESVLARGLRAVPQPPHAPPSSPASADTTSR